MKHQNLRRHGWLSGLAAAAVCCLWLAVSADPAAAQAARTRPPAGSSSSSSSGSSGGGGSVQSSPSGSSSSGGSAPVRVDRTRPSSSSGGKTVIDHRRPSSPRRSGSGGYYPRYGYDYYWSPWSHWWSIGWSWWYPWYPQGYPGGPYPYGPYGYGVTVYPSRVSASMGALDTDVAPARTEVWINGQYVGFVDQFDGWPRYLWLEKGTYDVVFYYPGFETLARQYTIYPGLVIDVGDRLVPGEAIHPNDLVPKTKPRRDARLRREAEQQAEAEALEDWRERARRGREERVGEAAGEPDQRPMVERSAVDARGEPGRLNLAIAPGDAAVYLDGRFLGTASELSALESGLLVDPGAHRLSVVRPGHDSQSLDFEVEAGEALDLTVDLKRAS